jgi:hypothetical protein
MLRDATKAVKAYSETITWFPHEVEKIGGLGELEEFLKHVVVGAVAKAKGITKEKLAPEIEDGELDNNSASEWSADCVFAMTVEILTSETRGRARARAVKSVNLHVGEVDQIWPAYVQLFRTVATEPDIPSLDFGDETGAKEWSSSTDLGVDFSCNLDNQALNHILNFPDGKPALFASFRSISRKCSWEAKFSHLFVEENEDMLPLSLLWHQRAGIAAIIEKIWTKTEIPDGVPGVLIADEVGVGKTALVMGTIAFLIDAYWVDQLALGPKAEVDFIPAGLDRSNVRKAPILGKYHDSQWHISHVCAVPVESRTTT